MSEQIKRQKDREAVLDALRSIGSGRVSDIATAGGHPGFSWWASEHMQSLMRDGRAERVEKGLYRYVPAGTRRARAAGIKVIEVSDV